MGFHIFLKNFSYCFKSNSNEYPATLKMKPIKKNIYYYQIQSDHGHDAFLIEFKQMKSKLNHIFEN